MHTAPREFGLLTLTSVRDGDVHSIRLFGELDLANTALVEREIAQAEAGGAPTIVIDLSGLLWVDSTGVQLLLSAHARSRAHRHRLALVPAPAEVQRVFELCGATDLLPFVATA